MQEIQRYLVQLAGIQSICTFEEEGIFCYPTNEKLTHTHIHTEHSLMIE